jgi:polar amino acid transport system substrate-binding protein
MYQRTIFRSLAALAVVGVVASIVVQGPNARAKSIGARHMQAGSSLHLINPGYLTVGSDTTYPPMESIANGQAEGADVDLANALAHVMGLKGAKIISNDFNTIIPSMLIRHKFDVIMSSMNDNPDRRKSVLFVDYMKSSQAILVRTSSSIHGNSYAAVCGHSIAVESGTTELDGLNAQNKTCKSKITIKIFTKDTDAYQAFVSRHTEAYTGDLPVVTYYVQTHRAIYRAAGKPFAAGEFYGIAMPRNAFKLRNAISQALRKIRANGQYRGILQKWGVAGAAV